jgi:hypothetical protein
MTTTTGVWDVRVWGFILGLGMPVCIFVLFRRPRRRGGTVSLHLAEASRSSPACARRGEPRVSGILLRKLGNSEHTPHHTRTQYYMGPPARNI